MEFEDTLFWPMMQDGCYSCNFDYRFLKEEAELEVRDVEDNQGKGLWKSIWSLQVSNKVKNFVWRAYRNSLPIKDEFSLSYDHWISHMRSLPGLSRNGASCFLVMPRSWCCSVRCGALVSDGTRLYSCCLGGDSLTLMSSLKHECEIMSLDGLLF